MNNLEKEVEEFVFTEFQREILGRIERLSNLERHIYNSDLVTLQKAPMASKVRDEIVRLIKLLLVDAGEGDNKNK